METPRILTDTSALASAGASGASGASDASGAVWRLVEPVRHLDANVIALPAGDAIAAHDGPDEDVLWHVIAGSGTLSTADGEVALAPGAVVWLPRGSRRAVRAGSEGLRYLSVHRRKGGLRIGRGPVGGAG